LTLADAVVTGGSAEEQCDECLGSGKYTVQVRNYGLSAANGYGPATIYNEWRGCRHCGGDHDHKGTGKKPKPITHTFDADRLAVLSDALEEAGCDNEELLRHLRGYEWCRNCFDDPSVRGGDECRENGCVDGWRKKDVPCVLGCWAVDLIHREKAS